MKIFLELSDHLEGWNRRKVGGKLKGERRHMYTYS